MRRVNWLALCLGYSVLSRNGSSLATLFVEAVRCVGAEGRGRMSFVVSTRPLLTGGAIGEPPGGVRRTHCREGQGQALSSRHSALLRLLPRVARAGVHACTSGKYVPALYYVSVHGVSPSGLAGAQGKQRPQASSSQAPGLWEVLAKGKQTRAGRACRGQAVDGRWGDTDQRGLCAGSGLLQVLFCRSGEVRGAGVRERAKGGRQGRGSLLL